MLYGDSLQEELYSALTGALLSETLIDDEAGTRPASYINYDLSRLSAKSNATRNSNLLKCGQLCDNWAASCINDVSIPCAPEHGLPSFEVSFVWSSFLEPEELRESLALKKLRERHNASVFVVNTGDHTDRVGTEEEKENERQNPSAKYDYLKHFFGNLSQLYRDEGKELSVIYRTAVPGHNECDKIFRGAPLTSYTEAEIDSNSFNVDAKAAGSSAWKKYRWASIHEVNEYVRRLVVGPRALFPAVVFMDVYNSTIRRGDGHPGGKYFDCLHYCLPGPIDEWTTFLFNALHAATVDGSVARSERGTNAGTSAPLVSGTEEDLLRAASVLGDIPSNLTLIRTAQAPPATEGRCVKAADSTSVYLVVRGVKHIIPDFDAFLALGCNGHRGSIFPMQIYDLYKIPLGLPLQVFSNGTFTFGVASQWYDDNGVAAAGAEGEASITARRGSTAAKRKLSLRQRPLI